MLLIYCNFVSVCNNYGSKEKTREDVLERKREFEKLRYQRIKIDNEQRNALKQKKKEYYLKRKA